MEGGRLEGMEGGRLEGMEGGRVGREGCLPLVCL